MKCEHNKNIKKVVRMIILLSSIAFQSYSTKSSSTCSNMFLVDGLGPGEHELHYTTLHCSLQIGVRTSLSPQK